ncbi:MAG: hypothetical protein JW787_08785 [Sedimentisphaerales bacterium]|nr:hypothetical protein [Sedimentisphaerales bacterium]
MLLDTGDENKEKTIHVIAIVFLIAAGLIYSLSFFGYFPVPNSDFPAFLDTGQRWLHFQIPNSMKRAPVFSIITALSGLPFSRPDRYLIGSELYNALLLPAVMILIYMVCRKINLRGAVWIALAAGASPWMVRLSSEPLAELTLIAFFAAAVVCVRENIKLAYLFAALASISRWDMAGLLPAVALADLVQNRKWGRTIILSIAASMPFILCMIITSVQLKGQTGGSHYLQVLEQDRTFELAEDLRLYWKGIMSFLNVELLQKQPSGEQESFKTMNSVIFWITASVLLAAFLTGAVFSFIRRQWEIIVMLITAAPYVFIHAMYPYRLPRFCVPVQWVGLLVAVYGIEIVRRKFFDGNKRKLLITLLSITGTAVFILWALKMGDTFINVRKYCPAIGITTVSVCLIALASFIVMEIIRRSAPSGRWLLLPAFLILATVSSGANIGRAMGNGKSDANFKKLAEWFLDNAKEDDKLMTTMAGFMPIFTGLPAERFLHTGSIPVEDADDFIEFIEKCSEEGVTIIAWDSRIPSADRYYKLWGLDRIKVLSAPVYGTKVDTIDRCSLVHMFTEGKPKIAIYRIMPEDYFMLFED